MHPPYFLIQTIKLFQRRIVLLLCYVCLCFYSVDCINAYKHPRQVTQPRWLSTFDPDKVLLPRQTNKQRDKLFQVARNRIRYFSRSCPSSPRHSIYSVVPATVADGRMMNIGSES